MMDDESGESMEPMEDENEKQNITKLQYKQNIG